MIFFGRRRLVVQRAACRGFRPPVGAGCLAILGITLSVEDHNAGRYDDPPYLFVHLNQGSLLEAFNYAARSSATEIG